MEIQGGLCNKILRKATYNPRWRSPRILVLILGPVGPVGPVARESRQARQEIFLKKDSKFSKIFLPFEIP